MGYIEPKSHSPDGEAHRRDDARSAISAVAIGCEVGGSSRLALANRVLLPDRRMLLGRCRRQDPDGPEVIDTVVEDAERSRLFTGMHEKNPTLTNERPAGATERLGHPTIGEGFEC
jgi:hypothetical protein